MKIAASIHHLIHLTCETHTALKASMLHNYRPDMMTTSPFEIPGFTPVKVGHLTTQKLSQSGFYLTTEKYLRFERDTSCSTAASLY